MENKFKVVIETPNSTVNYTIRDLEDDDFEAFKKETGRKGLQRLLDYLQGLRTEIYSDIVTTPVGDVIR